ncbi:DUF6868 family protein [Candidatus Omnitrophota bacterium]
MGMQILVKFFMWCTIINAVLYTLSAVMCIFASDFVYRIHSKWFPMPKETFRVVLYSFLGLYKLLFIVFSVVPYVALLLVVK